MRSEYMLTMSAESRDIISLASYRRLLCLYDITFRQNIRRPIELHFAKLVLTALSSRFIAGKGVYQAAYLN